MGYVGPSEMDSEYYFPLQSISKPQRLTNEVPTDEEEGMAYFRSLLFKPLKFPKGYFEVDDNTIFDIDLDT